MANRNVDYSDLDSDHDLSRRGQPYNRHNEKNSWKEEWEEEVKADIEELEDWWKIEMSD